MERRFRPGDRVVFCKPKRSAHPGMRAKAIYPAPRGDDYSYYIDKHWTVVAMGPDGTVIVCTRRGKLHSIQVTDPRLRKATWWERILLRQRFPRPQSREGAHGERTDSTAAVAAAMTFELKRT
jgi:hypothetical protein